MPELDEELKRYVDEKINPIRIKAGLKPITHEQAKEMVEIIERMLNYRPEVLGANNVG